MYADYSRRGRKVFEVKQSRKSKFRSCMDVAPTTILLFFSTIISSLAEKEQTNCTEHEFKECLTVLEAIGQRDDLALAATREELNVVCRKLQQGARCIDDHSFRCFTSVQKRIYNSVVSGSRHVIENLCVPGKLQNDYLTHAPCFKNVSTDLRKCALQYRRLADNHVQETEDEANMNYMLRFHCCVFTEFVQCQNEHLPRDCGPQAEEFYQSHMERMSDPLINEHCAAFTHGSNACAFNAGVGHKSWLFDFWTMSVAFTSLFTALKHTLWRIKR